MIQQLQTLRVEAKTRIASVETLHELYNVKAWYLGKKSPLQEVLSLMKNATNEEKRDLGQKANEFKEYVLEEIAIKQQQIEQKEIKRKLDSEAIDVTLPGKVISVGHLHPLSIVQEEIESIFIGMGYQIAEGPEVEYDLYSFEMLNLPVGHPAREMQDSFYIDPTRLLRPHTSPVQVRTMLEQPNTPIKIICPGTVYRRDNDDATHSHQFKQIEGLVIGTNVTMSDLKGTLEVLAKKMFGEGLNIRFRPSFFPFTEPSVEVDVTCFKCKGKGCSICKGNGWIEILGAGMVHPNVLTMAGYDAKVYQGFAFGLGIERVAMLRYGIDDIRHFYTNDVRFLKQF